MSLSLSVCLSVSHLLDFIYKSPSQIPKHSMPLLLIGCWILGASQRFHLWSHTLSSLVFGIKLGNLYLTELGSIGSNRIYKFYAFRFYLEILLWSWNLIQGLTPVMPSLRHLKKHHGNQIGRSQCQVYSLPAWHWTKPLLLRLLFHIENAFLREEPMKLYLYEILNPSLMSPKEGPLCTPSSLHHHWV